MSLFEQALTTYKNFEYLTEEPAEEGHMTMAPIAHAYRNIDVEILLDQHGKFCGAKMLEKGNKKTIIPVTESSAGRSSGIDPNPLFDKVEYLAPDLNEEKHAAYLEQLTAWVKSDEAVQELMPVYQYIVGGTIVDDIIRSDVLNAGKKANKKRKEPEQKDIGKLFIRFSVTSETGRIIKLWEDPDLRRSFVSWYLKRRANDPTGICYITGENTVLAAQHAKGILSNYGNARLISQNDKTGFSYRGRFSNEQQALTVGYEASQMAHNALAWLLEEQNVGSRFFFGGMGFLVWSPSGVDVSVKLPMPVLFGNAAETVTESFQKPSDYRDAVKNVILGYGSTLKPNDKMVIAAFDAMTMTSGRLSIVAYHEIDAKEYFEQMANWDLKCCWFTERFGIQSPSLYKIVNYAFGTYREENGVDKVTASDVVMKNTMKRLIESRLLGQKFPLDIQRAMVANVSRLSHIPRDIWEDMVFVACAVMNKQMMDNKQEEAMSWSFDKKDRSFQYGRLLAAMERAEADLLKSKDRERQTNAMKALERFRQHPYRTFEEVNRRLTEAYLPRLKTWQRLRYERTRDEIVAILSEIDADELDSRLDDTYLIGYSLQRRAFFAKSENTEPETEEAA